MSCADDAELRRFERSLKRRVTIGLAGCLRGAYGLHAGDAVALQAKLQR